MLVNEDEIGDIGDLGVDTFVVSILAEIFTTDVVEVLMTIGDVFDLLTFFIVIIAIYFAI